MKVVISFILFYFIYKNIKEKTYIVLFINFIFLIIFNQLSSNPLNENMMSNIEMYYTDKYPIKKDIINDSNFSGEASSQKFYAKHAPINLMVNSQYINTSKNLKFSIIYYYEICLFFKSNECVYKMNNRKISKTDYSREEYDYKYNKLKFYYRKFEFASNLKEGILIRDDRYKKYKDSYNLNCLDLFYASQNGWSEYQEKLIKELKDKDSCYDQINNNFHFSDEVQKTENKDNLIKFLIYNIKEK